MSRSRDERPRVGRRASAWAGQAPAAASRARRPGQPPRPCLRRRAVLQHRLGHRPGRQQAARRHPARRAATGELQPAVHRASSWCTAWASRPTTAPSPWCRSARTPSPSSTPRPTPSSTSPMSAARRTRRSSRRTARRSGSRSAARTTVACWTARPTRRRRGSLCPTARG